MIQGTLLRSTFFVCPHTSASNGIRSSYHTGRLVEECRSDCTAVLVAECAGVSAL